MNTQHNIDPSAPTAIQQQEPITAQTSQSLTDTQQAEYEKEYLSQLKKQQCPGCGETDLF